MRAKLIESNKPEHYIHAVRNVDSGSVSSISTVFNSIPQGTPVVLNLSQTAQPPTYQNGLPAGFEDGLQVCLPVSAANNMSLGSALSLELFHYGIAVGNIAYNALGEVMVHGVYPFALFVRATRSASSASWSSSASLAGSSVLLSIDSLNNAYTTVATTAASNALSNVPVYLLDSIASFAASASATSDTRTAMITTQRVFIREM
jgi:hypothetical protein